VQWFERNEQDADELLRLLDVSLLAGLELLASRLLKDKSLLKGEVMDTSQGYYPLSACRDIVGLSSERELKEYVQILGEDQEYQYTDGPDGTYLVPRM
jgi:hypothetical protein